MLENKPHLYFSEDDDLSDTEEVFTDNKFFEEEEERKEKIEAENKNYKYVIKKSMFEYKRDWKRFNDDNEFFNYCKSIDFQFHLINNFNNKKKCLFFDIDNTKLTIEEVKQLVVSIIFENFGIKDSNFIIEQRNKDTGLSYHIHNPLLMVDLSHLKFVINEYKKTHEEYNCIDTMIYDKNHSFRYSMTNKKKESNDSFIKLNKDISESNFFKTIFAYTNNAKLIELNHERLLEFNKNNTDFINDKKDTNNISLDYYKEFRHYADKIINTYLTKELIHDYQQFFPLCYLIAGITSGDINFRSKIYSKMKSYNVPFNANKYEVLNYCFRNYPNFIKKSPCIYRLLTDYIVKFNNTIDKYKDSRIRGAINCYNTQAGSGKSGNIINTFFSSPNFNDCKNTLIITPRRLNSNDLANKFLMKSYMKKRDMYLYQNINEYTINDYNINKGIVCIIEEGISLTSINKKLHEIIDTPLKIEGRYNTFLDEDILFNKNIKICIITTDKSLFKVVEYTKANSIYFDILVIDEMIQVIENIQKNALNIIGQSDMSVYLYNLIKLTETVFLSNIYQININNIFINRIINNVVNNADNPSAKFMSYKKIMISNTQIDFDNIIDSCDGCFIWSDLNTECQKIMQYLIHEKQIPKNEIVILTRDNTWDDKLLSYKYIISSPKIFSCISIGLDDDYNRSVIAVIRGHHISNYNIINSIQRVRKSQQLNIFTNFVSNINRKISFKNNYLYDSDIDKNFNSLIEAFNSITLKEMIDSLIKTEDYTYIENITDIKEDQLVFNYPLIVEKPKKLTLPEIAFIESFIKKNENENENENCIIIKTNFNKYSDIEKLLLLADDFLISSYDYLVQPHIVNEDDDLSDNDNDDCEQKKIKKNNKIINYTKQYNFLTNFGKVKTRGDDIASLNYKLILKSNIYSKILKNFVNKNSDIREFKSFGIFCENANVISNINKINFIAAKTFIKTIESDFNKTDYLGKIKILENFKDNKFDKTRKITIPLKKKIIDYMIITQNNNEFLLKDIKIFNIDNYINSLSDDDDFKKTLLSKKIFSRLNLKIFKDRKVFDNCFNIRLKLDKNNNLNLVQGEEFSIKWNYQLLETKDINRYFTNKK